MPTHPKHLVQLTQEERAFLEQHTKSGDWTPRQVTRARILLLADIDGPEVALDEEICERVGCSLSTVSKRRKRFIQTGSIEDTIFDRPRNGRPTIIDGAVDAQMTAIACSNPPEGRSKWTLRLIRDRMVSLEVVDEISHSTVARALKKRKSNPG